MNDKVVVGLNATQETLGVIQNFLWGIGVGEIDTDYAEELYYSIIKAAEVKE